MTSPGENVSPTGAESGMRTTMTYLLDQCSQFAREALDILNDTLFGARPTDQEGRSVTRVMWGKRKSDNGQVEPS